MDKRQKKSGIIHNPILKMIGDIITWTILVLLILIALFLLYYVISSQIYASRGEKYEPKISLYTIISGSMIPTIDIYDVVVNGRVDDPTTLKAGDIITFKSTGSLTYGETITHRILEVVETSEGIKYRTKGDNNVTPDGAYVEPSNIIGKVLFKIPQLGRVQFFLIKAGGWLFVVLIPSLCIVLYDVLKVIKLSSTKKKISDSNNKENDKLDKQKQEELKEEIKSRLEDKKEVKLPILRPKQIPINDELDNEVNNLITNAIDSISSSAAMELKEKREDNDLSEELASEYIQKSIDLDKVLKKLNVQVPTKEEDSSTDDFDLPKMKK